MRHLATAATQVAPQVIAGLRVVLKKVKLPLEPDVPLGQMACVSAYQRIKRLITIHFYGENEVSITSVFGFV